MLQDPRESEEFHFTRDLNHRHIPIGSQMLIEIELLETISNYYLITPPLGVSAHSTFALVPNALMNIADIIQPPSCLSKCLPCCKDAPSGFITYSTYHEVFIALFISIEIGLVGNPVMLRTTIPLRPNLRVLIPPPRLVTIGRLLDSLTN